MVPVRELTRVDICLCGGHDGGGLVVRILPALAQIVGGAGLKMVIDCGRKSYKIRGKLELS